MPVKNVSQNKTERASNVSPSGVMPRTQGNPNTLPPGRHRA
jgi:hypothetical protein